MLAKEITIDLVDGSKIGHIHQENSGLDHVLFARPSGREHCREILHHLRRLAGSIGAHHVTGLGVQCDLTAGIKPWSYPTRLHVGAYGGRGLVGMYDFAHESPLKSSQCLIIGVS